MKYSLILQLCILCLLSQAQNTYFNKRFDHSHSPCETGFSIIVDSDKITIAIATCPTGPLATAILQLDLNGNTIDTSLISYPFTNVYPGGTASLNRTDNVSVLGGSFVDTTKSYVLLFKLDHSGDTLLTQKYGSPYYFSSDWMAKQINNNYFISGQEVSAVSQKPSHISPKPTALGI